MLCSIPIAIPIPTAMRLDEFRVFAKPVFSMDNPRAAGREY